MKAKKVMACLMAGVLTFSAAACGSDAGSGADTSATTTETSTAESQATETTTAESGSAETTATAAAADAGYVYDDAASITFADGSISFLGSDTTVNPAAKETLVELASVDGHDAAKVTSAAGDKMFLGIQMDKLLGSDLSKAASIEIGLRTETGSSFAATSGNIYVFSGGSQSGTPWSIYMANKNPKTIEASLPSGLAEGDYVVLTLESSGGDIAEAVMYVETISFKDASGNVLAVDTSVEYETADTGVDRSNLFGITDEIVVEGLAGAGDGWAQIGYQELTDDEWAALTTPGSVVEISYASETGNMWMGLSGDAWTRIGVGDADGSGQGYAYYNASKNIAQIPYEVIAAVCGSDTSTWDKSIFIESDSAFEVFSVKIGQQAPNAIATNTIDLGISGSGDGWGQIGYQELTEEQLAALHDPNAVVVVEYSSESGDLWIGLSGDAWNRVGVGDADGSGTVNAITDGSVCYVTYDMIASVCGNDPEAWDKSIFVESDTAFEVYSTKIGTLAEIPANNRQIDLELSGAGDGWGQIGYQELTEDQLAALQTEGSVVVVEYSSESGNLWIGLSGDAWNRVGVGNIDGSGSPAVAVCDGSKCYVTYDMIAAVCGADPSAWDKSIFIESDTAFEVYSVKIGQSK